MFCCVENSFVFDLVVETRPRDHRERGGISAVQQKRQNFKNTAITKKKSVKVKVKTQNKQEISFRTEHKLEK